MKLIPLSLTSPQAVRAAALDPRIVSAELFQAEADGHKFKVGQRCKLTGLEDFAEYNGDRVTITAIRDDGPNGRAYYIEGRINEMLNWVYEYRLTT